MDISEEMEFSDPDAASQHPSRVPSQLSTFSKQTPDEQGDHLCLPPIDNNFAKYREYTEYIRNSGVLRKFGRCILSIYGAKAWPPPEKLVEQILNAMGDEVADKKILMELYNQRQSLNEQLEALLAEREQLYIQLDEFEISGPRYELDADELLNPYPGNNIVDKELLKDVFSNMKLPPDSRDNESSSVFLGDLLGRPTETLFQDDIRMQDMESLLVGMLTVLGYKIPNKGALAELSTQKHYMNEILEAVKTERPDPPWQVERFEDAFAEYNLFEKPPSPKLPSQGDDTSGRLINVELLLTMFAEMEEIPPDDLDGESPDFLSACVEEPKIVSKPCQDRIRFS